MSLLLYDNKVSTVISVTASVSAGTLTNQTDPEKILNRNLADAYHFTCSTSATMTVTIGFSGGSIKSMGLLSISDFGSMGLKNGFSVLTPDHTDIKRRYKDSERIKDIFFTLDTNIVTTEISFTFSVSSGSQFIGAAWLSNGVEIPVKIPVSYAAADTSVIDTSNGGQVYSSIGESYETVKFKSQPIAKDLARANDLSIRDMNLNTGSHSPIVFLPQHKDDVHIYGYQKTLASFQQVEALDGSGDWFWVCSFNITEEL